MNLQFDQVLVLVDTSKVHNQRKLTQDFSRSLWLSLVKVQSRRLGFPLAGLVLLLYVVCI